MCPPVIYARVDLDDLLKFPVDQPHNMGDRPILAAASEIGLPRFQPYDIVIVCLCPSAREMLCQPLDDIIESTFLGVAVFGPAGL